MTNYPFFGVDEPAANGIPLSQYLFRSPSLFALQWPFLGLYGSGKGTPKASTEASLRGSLRLSWAL